MGDEKGNKTKLFYEQAKLCEVVMVGRREKQCIDIKFWLLWKQERMSEGNESGECGCVVNVESECTGLSAI